MRLGWALWAAFRPFATPPPFSHRPGESRRDAPTEPASRVPTPPSAAGVAACTCVLTCACVPAAAFASVRTTDRAATRAYLRATYADERVLYTELARIVASIEARANEIGSECPDALTYAPRDAAFEELGEEAEITRSMPASRRCVRRRCTSRMRSGACDGKITGYAARARRGRRRTGRGDAGAARPVRGHRRMEGRGIRNAASECRELPRARARHRIRVKRGATPGARSRIQAPASAPRGTGQRRLANRVERLQQRVDGRIAAAERDDRVPHERRGARLVPGLEGSPGAGAATLVACPPAARDLALAPSWQGRRGRGDHARGRLRTDQLAGGGLRGGYWIRRAEGFALHGMVDVRGVAVSGNVRVAGARSGRSSSPRT